MSGIDLGELKALIDLLRAEGITSFQRGELRLELGVKPEGEQYRPGKRHIPDELRGLPQEYLDEALGIRWEPR